MNKYTLLSVIEVTEVIYVIAVIFLSAYFQNYWLLLFVLLAGLSEKTFDAIIRSILK